jgi:hypothetical protein
MAKIRLPAIATIADFSLRASKEIDQFSMLAMFAMLAMNGRFPYFFFDAASHVSTSAIDGPFVAR